MCSEFWSKKKKFLKMYQIRYLILYPHPTINFTLFAIILFSHLEVRIIISINVIQYILCKSFQKLCQDSSGIFNSCFISKVCSVPVASDHCFEHFAYMTEFCSSKDPGLDHMFPVLLQAYRGEPQFGTQMPESWNRALSCFVLNQVNEKGRGKKSYFLFCIFPCIFYLAFQ